MKLIAKYNRVNIAATVLVLLVSGLGYYFILKSVLIHQLDKDLKIEQQEIKDYVKTNNSLPEASNYKDLKISFTPSAEVIEKASIKSISMYNDAEEEMIPSRQLSFSILVKENNYKVSITKSQQETEDMVELIVKITLAIVVLLLLVLFIINRFVLNKLWHPFNDTLQKLQQFNLSNRKHMELSGSDINEFTQLNTAVTSMSNRVIKDYDALKSFTENASHEIQTPLAVVNSKLELLMQSENFTETQMQYIQSIQGEVNRLSKLNQSLLLLTKIDNQQFTGKEAVSLAKIISNQLSNYEELVAAKHITLTKNIDDAVLVYMNETMAAVLVTNLITNAIKHNIEKGSIDITLNEQQLQISNTGQPLNTDPQQLFERFKKDKVQSESLGLGLSIVKKICEQYNFTATYHYAGNQHIVTILFTGS
ncbi:sensor histidine kinase [Ferruginibacter sp.]